MMAGTTTGARKAVESIKLSDPDHWSKAGKKGGSKSNPKKGFGSNRELAVVLGRKKKKVYEQRD